MPNDGAEKANKNKMRKKEGIYGKKEEEHDKTWGKKLAKAKEKKRGKKRGKQASQAKNETEKERLGKK